MLARKEQLVFCKVCENKNFSQKEGIICKITNAQATFKTTCDDYSGDQKTINNLNQRYNFDNRINDFTFGLEYIGIKNGAISGLIVMGVGFIWLIIGIIKNAIHLYSFGVIILGLVGLIYSLINMARRKKRGPLAGEKLKNDDLLDSNL
tara:strand:- start:5 stop:451 length:447 start_codon:yes stop_codon:yes gene_type:complete